MKFLKFIFIFLFLISLVGAVVNIDDLSSTTAGVNIEIPEPPPFNNNTGFVNSSNFWNTDQGPLANPSDILANGMWTRTGTQVALTNSGDDVIINGSLEVGGNSTINANNILQVDQPDDNVGMRIWGFDDVSTSWIDFHVNRFGNGVIDASGNFAFEASTTVGSGLFFRLADDAMLDFGPDDYEMLYNSASTQFEFNSKDIDGVGTNGPIFTVQDGTDDVVFNGKVVAGGGATSPAVGTFRQLVDGDGVRIYGFDDRAADGINFAINSVGKAFVQALGTNDVLNNIVDYRFGDDYEVQIGSSIDYKFYYDSANTKFVFRTADSDGSQTIKELININDGTDDISFFADLQIDSDTNKLFLGDGQDVSHLFDGTSYNITAEVGSPNLEIDMGGGDLMYTTSADSNNVQFTNTNDILKFISRGYKNDANGNRFEFRRSRGSQASPSAILDGDEIFQLIGKSQFTPAWNFQEAGRISLESDGNTGAGSNPGKWSFYTTPSGATTSTSPKMVIRQDGKVGIGLSDPTSEFHVIQTADTANNGWTLEGLGGGMGTWYINSNNNSVIDSSKNMVMTGKVDMNINAGETINMDIGTNDNLRIRDDDNANLVTIAEATGLVTFFGSAEIDSDTNKLFLGDGQDVSHLFDGTSYNITAEVGNPNMTFDMGGGNYHFLNGMIAGGKFPGFFVPSADLHIAGDGDTDVKIVASGTGTDANLQFEPTSGGFGQFTCIGEDFRIQGAANKDIRFNVNTATTTDIRFNEGLMFMDASENGISIRRGPTSSPRVPLDINGSTIIDGDLNVSWQGWINQTLGINSTDLDNETLDVGGFARFLTPLGGFSSDEDTTGEVTVDLTDADVSFNLTNLNASAINVGEGIHFNLNETLGTISFTEDGLGIYSVNFHGSFMADRTGVYHCWVTKDGDKQEISWERNIGNANQVGSASGFGHIIINATNQQSYIQCETNAATNPTLTFNHFSFKMERVSRLN